MTLSTILTEAIEDIFSDTDIAEASTVSFGGSYIPAVVIYRESEDEDDRGSIYNIMELRVKIGDVTGINYRSEVTVGSDTWYFWKEREGSLYTKVLWFKKEERIRRRKF